MTRIVNLRQARKQRARDDKRAKGDLNAVRFGETRAEKRAREAEARRAENALKAHKRDD